MSEPYRALCVPLSEEKLAELRDLVERGVEETQQAHVYPEAIHVVSQPTIQAICQLCGFDEFWVYDNHWSRRRVYGARRGEREVQVDRDDVAMLYANPTNALVGILAELVGHLSTPSIPLTS